METKEKTTQVKKTDGTKAKPRNLGRGLDALIPGMIDGKESPTPDMFVKISRIQPRKDQPRKDFNEDRLEELAESIKTYGIIEPIVAQDRGSYYEIVAGERRWRAAMKAGLKEVPVIVKNFTEQEIAEISLIENVQREDLNPIEKAMGFKQLIEKFNCTQERVAKIISKDRTAVTNTLRLLNLDERVQDMLREEMITQGHAKVLLALPDKEKQYELAQEIFDQELSVRTTEKLVKASARKKDENPKKALENELIYQDFETRIRDVLGTKVNIKRKDNMKGKIEIEYYTEMEFERISDLLLSIGSK